MNGPIDAGLEDPTGPSATSPARRKGEGMFGPPGILFYLATVAAIGLAKAAHRLPARDRRFTVGCKG